MALYSIESEQCLGMAHFGGEVTVNGEGTVELSDEEELGNLMDAAAYQAFCEKE